MKNTKFQNKLLQDKECLWDLVKLFHPNIPDTVVINEGKVLSVKDDKMAAYPRYSWVSVDFRVRGYGLVNFAVNNKENFTLWGNGVTKADMQEALDNGDVTMGGWRISLDKIYKEDPRLSDKNRNGLSYLAGRILALHGYSLIEVDEWFESYYED